MNGLVYASMALAVVLMFIAGFAFGNAYQLHTLCPEIPADVRATIARCT